MIVFLFKLSQLQQIETSIQLHTISYRLFPIIIKMYVEGTIYGCHSGPKLEIRSAQKLLLCYVLFFCSSSALCFAFNRPHQRQVLFVSDHKDIWIVWTRTHFSLFSRCRCVSLWIKQRKKYSIAFKCDTGTLRYR